MFAVGTYEEIEENEKKVENQEIVIFLFVKPNTDMGNQVVKEFEYIHYNTDKYCSVYAIGYSNNPEKLKDSSKAITTVDGTEWLYIAKDFVDFKNKLENRIRWKYSGETEVMILQNNINKTSNVLNFQNYVAINIEKGIREGYIESFQTFMESVMREAKSSIEADELVKNVRRKRIQIKDIITGAIEDCKKIPAPAKKIMKDRLFYRSAINISGRYC